MNNEPSEQKRKLLNDVFRADSFDTFNGQLRQRVLSEFRRGRFIRRATSISLTAAIVAALITCALLFRVFDRTRTTLLAKVPARNEGMRQTAAQPKESASDLTLTDEQLIAFFPSNSCFLAEVEGRKILVFRNPELRQKYLH